MMRHSVKSLTSSGALVTVTQRELDNLLSGECDLLIRKFYPKKINTVDVFILYLVLKRTTKVKAVARCSFIMHTIGIDVELQRAGVTEEEFEKKFTRTYHFPEGSYEHADAFAWTISAIRPANLQISDFLATNSKKNQCAEITKLARGFTYAMPK